MLAHFGCIMGPTTSELASQLDFAKLPTPGE